MKFLTIFLFCSFVFLLGVNLAPFLPHAQPSVSSQLPEQIILERIISFSERRIAQLQHVTSRILYSLHRQTESLTTTIPQDGVLDGAIGIDPLIREMYWGDVLFEVIGQVRGGKPQRLFHKRFSLDNSPWQAGWQEFSVDLSAFAGQQMQLQFIKRCLDAETGTWRTIYDLIPEDLLLWRWPQIRPATMADHPDVILVSIDTLRADRTQFMGYTRTTSPNLDRLSRNGTIFTTTVSQAPWTTPSHFSLFTSTYPSIHLANEPIFIHTRRWNRKLPTMASLLAEHGYRTAAFTGTGPISAIHGFYKGFDSYDETGLGEKGSDVEAIFQKAIEWIARNRNRTFFLFIHTYEVHHPYRDNLFIKDEAIEEEDRFATANARYDGDIRRVDLHMGNLMETLQRLGLAHKTLLIVTSDHGESLDEVRGLGHGHSLYDDLLLVPLLFYSPGRIPAARIIDSQVALIDVLPTLLDILGYPFPKSVQGESLLEAIRGGKPPQRPIYAEATTSGPEREALRYDGYKYIHRLSYGQLARAPFSNRKLPPVHELYDLLRDPLEKNNLAKQQPQRVARYQIWIQKLFPNRTFTDIDQEQAEERVDISRDKELLESLQRLGYIE